jgi:hypothetical protein
LLQHHVYNLKVAEIENIFCIEPLIRIVAEHQGLNADLVIKEVTDFIIAALKSEFDVQVSSRAEKRIEFLLGAYSKEANTEKGLIDGLKTTLGKIDVPAIFEESRKVFQDAIDSSSLDQLLFIYNRKSLQSRIAHIFKLSKGEYTPLIIRLLKSEKKQAIIEALKNYLPKLP